MYNADRNMKICCITLLAKTGLQAAYMVFYLIALGAAATGGTPLLPSSFNMGGLIAILVVGLLMAGVLSLDVIIGVQGIRRANGSTSGKAGVVIAWIMLILTLIGVLISLIEIVFGKAQLQWLTAVNTLLSVALYVAYLKLDKQLF